jgi:hypothetical protein
MSRNERSRALHTDRPVPAILPKEMQDDDACNSLRHVLQCQAVSRSFGLPLAQPVHSALDQEPWQSLNKQSDCARDETWPDYPCVVI